MSTMQEPGLKMDDIDDIRWQAVIDRNSTADPFVYGVITTGVYCKPGCASRAPRRHNIRFFETPEAAEQAGLRPCKRCKPNEQPTDDKIEVACRFIEKAEEVPSLEEVAAAVGLSPHHFHREFKRRVGVTPKTFGKAVRQARLEVAMVSARTVTEALYHAGFGSSGRFYADAQATLGMKPTDRRAKGQGQTIRFALGQTRLGSILVATTVKGICQITIGDDPDILIENFQREFANAELIGGDPAFDALVARVVGLIDTPAPDHDLPLDIQGTAFQQRVWQALRNIPMGQTMTYAQVAQYIGQPSATRAVANACAKNNLAVAIPCHRVVRTDGGLGGYRWGIERKAALLVREGAA